MTGTVENSYDNLPYPSHPIYQTHPDNLAAVAILLGMTPVPVENCRVLELGCASGGNLIPMAYDLPESEFTGIDFSARQIDAGQPVVAALGLTNLRLEHRNILDIESGFGQFDYIIAHGIYSWVPPEVRDKIFDICRQNLSQNGLAYISYNTYPGYTMMKMVREMMLYHTRHLTDPAERVAEARAFMNVLSELVPGDEAYGSFIKFYTQFRLNRRSEDYPDDESLLHDDLGDINQPVYFYEFAQHAARYGLQYLGEARFSTMFSGDFPASVFETLGNMATSIIEYEQYLDFLRHRQFRETLLCRENIPLSRKLKPESLANLHIASSALPASPQPDLHTVSREKFQADEDATITTDHPLTKAAMICLTRAWPQAVPFDDLLTMARSLLSSLPGPVQTGSLTEAQHDQLVASNLLLAYTRSPKLIELYTRPANLTIEVTERPVASPIARLQARQGAPSVTNMRHKLMGVDELFRQLLPHLDGHHDRADLTRIVRKLMAEAEDISPQRQQELSEEKVAEKLEDSLSSLARNGLLIA